MFKEFFFWNCSLDGDFVPQNFSFQVVENVIEEPIGRKYLINLCYIEFRIEALFSWCDRTIS